MYRAEPKQIKLAKMSHLEIIYLFIDGDRAGTYGLASMVINNGYEETAIFPCDAEGEVSDWIPMVATWEMDNEVALNKIGYSTKVENV
jgi:hypothetical protein